MFSKLQGATKRYIDAQQKQDKQKKLKINLDSYQNMSLLCDYQKQWLLDESKISVIEKSRQIGFSWVMSLRAVLKCIEDERDTIVTSYNKPAVKQFIKDASQWARIIATAVEATLDKQIVKEPDLNIFELRFLNGRSIIGLAGDAVNLRSYSGRDIVIDEAAYREVSLDEILASATAAIIHGGTIRIGSTHCGEDSEFNQLVKDCRGGIKPYSVFKTTFCEAIDDGLFKRICLKNKEEWSLEKEDAFIDEIYDMYGIRAQEELDVIPSDFSGEGKVFDEKSFQVFDISQDKYNYVYFRYWDLAASDKETSYYSASIKVAYHVVEGTLTIVDYCAEQLEPKDGDDLIIETAQRDGIEVTQLIEQEPGSTGIKYCEIMRKKLSKLGLANVYFYQPKLSKMQRLIPVANACMLKKVGIIDAPWRNELIRILKKVSNKPKPLISDLADCLSGIYLHINENWY